jgi:hypothetical protein
LVSGPISLRHPKPLHISHEFIKNIEDELYRRIRRRVTLALGDGIIAARVESGIPAAEPVIIVMDSGPLLPRKRVAEWVDALERKINGEASPVPAPERTEDVERLFAEIQKSPGPEQTGAIVLTHVGDYDDEFFEALAAMIIREKAHRRIDRARNFEALRGYLREVRRRARKGETAQMWRELDRGAALEKKEELSAERRGDG